MILKQKIISLILSLTIFVVIIYFVKQKKLTEEFSWIWLLAGVLIVTMAICNKFFFFITHITGIVEPTSIAFFFGIIFLILLNLLLSINVSKNQEILKNLVQKIALYENELDSVKTELENLKEKNEFKK